MNKLDVIYDMETSDPDDAMTLCLLATHSRVNLRAVTITPGSQAQLDLVTHLFFLLNLDPWNFPIGTRNRNYPKNCVSEFHYKWLGNPHTFPIKRTAPEGYEVLQQTLQQYPDCIVLTGASLGNLRKLLEHYPASIVQRWVAQGGFAGDEVVPEKDRLPKFAGRNTCPTFNFNGDVPAAKLLLACDNVKMKQLVSKNVCHGVVYDQIFHEAVQPYRHHNIGLNLMFQGMEKYLQHHPSGKMFHDPLAACTLIEPSICDFAEVEVYRDKDEWGSRLKSGTNTFISIRADRDKFYRTLVGSD